MRVLLIEDNRALAENVGDYLVGHGCVVDYAADGPRGLTLAQRESFDIIVLDIGLPRLGGLALCRSLRHDFGLVVPVLMLTARDTLPDKLSGFDAGADDYLTKPFELAELYARLQALARRGRTLSTLLEVDDLRFDTATQRLTRGGQNLRLPPMPARILELLMRRSPDIVTRADLSHHVWGEDPPDAEASLRFHIHHLRNVIDKPFAVPLLRTVSGIGYRLVRGDEA